MRSSSQLTTLDKKVRKKMLLGSFLFCNPFFCLDRNTNHIDIGPVNKCINMLAVYWADGPDSENFKVRRVFDFVAQFLILCVSLFVQAHQARVLDYLWISEDGMKVGIML